MHGGTANRFGSPHDNAAAIAVKLRTDSANYSPVSFTGEVEISNGTIDGTSTGIRAGEAGKIVDGPAINITNVGITNAVHDAQNGDVENLTTSTMTVQLTSGDDILVTSPQSNGEIVFEAGDGLDDVTGGAGNEQIIGGAGSDSLTGGGGDDNFVFAFADANDATYDFDFINDFAPGDTIELTGGLTVDTVMAVGASNVLITLDGTDGDQIFVAGATVTEVNDGLIFTV
jgi:Ca2+-binding RTX toxin-like protein